MGARAGRGGCGRRVIRGRRGAVPDRACPSCHEPVLAHQTLCPACRTPVPSEAGPVATDTSAFTFSVPPPRPSHPAPAPAPASASAPAPAPSSSPGPATSPDAAPVSAPAVGDGYVVTTSPVPVGAPPPEAPSPDPTSVAPTGPPPTVPAAPPGPPAPAPAPAHHEGPSAGVIGTPGAPVLDERGNLPGGIAGLVAAVLVTIGVFLPWVAVEGRDVSGWAASADAKVLLGLAGVATVGAALLIGGARSLVLRVGLVVLGVVVVGLGLFEVLDASRIDDFDVSLGLGLPLVIGGGVVAAVAGALTRHRRFLPG